MEKNKGKGFFQGGIIKRGSATRVIGSAGVRCNDCIYRAKDPCPALATTVYSDGTLHCSWHMFDFDAIKETAEGSTKQI